MPNEPLNSVIQEDTDKSDNSCNMSKLRGNFKKP